MPSISQEALFGEEFAAKMLQGLKHFRNLVLLLAIFGLFWMWATKTDESIEHYKYGITFSPNQAKNLGLDWQKVYVAMLDDLGVRKIRISAYWESLEPVKEQLDWSELDWQLSEANKRQAEVILAVGGRLPRWPECHFPDWTKKLSKAQRERATLEYVAKVVLRYKNHPEITAWQVENEPFLTQFGECPVFDPGFLDQEIALVRSLDERPIIVTDSGELSLWAPAAKRADIFGTTMYRDTYSKALGSYIHYPITPTFFKIKKNLAGLFAKPAEWIVIELQAEPWANVQYQDIAQAERDRTMSEDKFIQILDFARATGFDTFYLWGVEWWYWEKEKQQRPFFWNEAKKIFH